MEKSQSFDDCLLFNLCEISCLMIDNIVFNILITIPLIQAGSNRLGNSTVIPLKCSTSCIVVNEFCEHFLWFNYLKDQT